MKKLYFILLLLAVASVHTVAQVMYYNYNVAKPAEKIRFENVDISQKGDTVNVIFDLMVEPKAVKNGQSIYIIPGVKAPKGEVSLPAILINGKKRSSYYKREQALQGKHPLMDITPAITMTSDNKDGQAAHYAHSFIMTQDLDGAEVVVDQFVEDCCEITPAGGAQKLGIPLRFRPVAEVKVEEPKPVEKAVEKQKVLDLRQSVTFLEPAQEVVKQREESFQAHIGYPVNQYDVRPYFENNSAELSRIDGVIAPLMREGLYSVRGLRIEGYASPEGNWGHNETLARNRANGFWNYLRGRYPVLQGVRNVNIMSFGEDWDGLVKLINEEYMPYNKYEILNIIQRYGIFEGREAKLMLYAGGAPYRYMLHNLFPKLRRMAISVDYDVKNFNDAEAASVYQTRPGDLSQYEMIRLARSQGTDVLATYDVAVLYFPDDPVALINASGAELIRGNGEKAWGYLSKVANDPRAYNNIGVCYLLKGDTENAKYYFRLAIPYDGTKANYNLRLVEREFPVPPTIAPTVVAPTNQHQQQQQHQPTHQQLRNLPAPPYPTPAAQQQHQPAQQHVQQQHVQQQHVQQQQPAYQQQHQPAYQQQQSTPAYNQQQGYQQQGSYQQQSAYPQQQQNTYQQSTYYQPSTQQQNTTARPVATEYYRYK